MPRMKLPALTPGLRKGDMGRIGIIGGSYEYTGAPFYAAASALKAGADLAYVFCEPAAMIPIKSYSPELIVHPVLGTDDFAPLLLTMLKSSRLDALVVGPGLGRDRIVLDTLETMLTNCLHVLPPMVFDADGLYFLDKRPKLRTVLRNVPRDGAFVMVGTPNLREEKRARTSYDWNPRRHFMLLKGEDDAFIARDRNDTETVAVFKSHDVCPRRCGGQGDLLAGVLGTFLAQQLKIEHAPMRVELACHGASSLVRRAASDTYKEIGRGMTTPDILRRLPKALRMFDEA